MRGPESESGWRTWLKAWLKDERAAWQWLTVLPIGSSPYVRETAAFPRALRAFPLVGALIGALGALVLFLLHAMGASAHLAAFLATLAILLMTGALHEDGLADFADALGGRDRQRRLAIMQDSRIGAFGVLALIMAVALPALALADILEQHGIAAAMIALSTAHALSRLAAVWLLAALPPARETGQSRAAGRPDRDVLLQAMSVAFLFGVLPGFFTFGVWFTLKALAAGTLAMLTLAAQAKRLLGGQTGDVAGATECVFRAAWLIMLSF